MAGTNVVVFVPAIEGSVLQLNGKTVWPGGVCAANGPYPNLDDLLSPDIVATDVIRNVSISKQYVVLIDALNSMGFPEKAANGNGKRLVPAPYDWRKSNAESAKTLDKIVQAVAAATPDANILLCAHSMGGLVARYYLESGAYTGSPGFARVAALIMLAVPSNGAVTALETILGLRDTVFLSRDQARKLCADPRYPSAYELLPTADMPFLWDGSAGGALSELSLYDPNTVSALGLSKVNLDGAQAFHKALSLDKKPSSVRYFTFVGTQFQTSTAGYLKGSTISPIQPDDSGDGTVPIWGSQLPGVQQIQVGGAHSTIYQDGGLIQYLRQLLGAGVGSMHATLAALTAPAMRPELQVRDHVVPSTGAIHIALSIPGLATAPTAAKDSSLVAAGAAPQSAEIRVEPIILDPATGVITYGPAVVRQAVQSPGPNSPRINVLIPAPAPGPYRVGYFPSGATAPEPTSFAILSVK